MAENANHGDGRPTRCWPWPPRPRAPACGAPTTSSKGCPRAVAGGRERRGRGADERGGERRAQRAGSRGYRSPTPPDSEGLLRRREGSATDLFVELLDRFGEAVQDIATAIGEREWFDGEPEGPTLELRGAPGHSAAVEFDFTNTGRSALAKVMFEATNLLGATEQIDADAVSFEIQGRFTHPPRRARSKGEGHRRGRDPRRGAGRSLPRGDRRSVRGARRSRRG